MSKYKKGENYNNCKDPVFYLDSYQKHMRLLAGEIVEITKLHPYMRKYLINVKKKVKNGTGN